MEKFTKILIPILCADRMPLRGCEVITWDSIKGRYAKAIYSPIHGHGFFSNSVDITKFVTHWMDEREETILCTGKDLEDFYNEGQAMGYAAAKMEDSFSDGIIDKAIGKDFEYVLQTKFKYLPPRGGIS